MAVALAQHMQELTLWFVIQSSEFELLQIHVHIILFTYTVAILQKQTHTILDPYRLHTNSMILISTYKFAELELAFGFWANFWFGSGSYIF